jgi:hypothetical protein
MTTLLSALLLSVATVTQAPVDFSGVWVENEALRQTTHKIEAGPKAGALPSRPITIKQTAELIDIEHEPPFPGWKPLRHVYNLAGKESVNNNGANTQTTKTRWDGKRLVTEGTSYSVTSAGESTWKYRQTLWLDAKGRLIMETRMADEAGTTNIVTLTYDKKR